MDLDTRIKELIILKNTLGKPIALLYAFLFLLNVIVFIPVSALVWDPTVVYHCDNEYYSVTTPITVDNVSISTHWFSVNGIGFNTTAPHNTHINFSTIKSYPKGSTGYIMNFTEQHAYGATQYIINGLRPSYDYIIITNGTDYPQTSSASGTLYLNQTGTSRNNKLYDPGIPTGWFVSLSTNVPAGSDVTGTGSITAPFATLRKAINASTTGDTICIRGGDYSQYNMGAGTHYYLINRSHITITAYNGEKVVIDGKYCALTGSSALIKLFVYPTTYWNNITFIGLNFSNCSVNAVYGHAYPGAGSNSNITFSDCEWFNITDRAIWLYSEESITTIPCQYWNINNCSFFRVQTNATMNEVVTLKDAKHFIYENNTMKEFTKQGLSLSSGTCYGVIQYNTFVNKYYMSLKMSGESSVNRSVHDIIIRNNNFTGGARATNNIRALVINNEQDNNLEYNIDIYNNIFYLTASTLYNYGFNIIYSPGTTGCKIWNIRFFYNTIYVMGGDTAYAKDIIVELGGTTVANCLIANNILVSEKCQYQIYFSDLLSTQTSFTLANNSFYHTQGTTSGIEYSAGSGFGTGSVVGDPDFHNNNTGDININATSPAIDAASATYTVPYDYESNSRPQISGYDIGAYEYVGSLPPPAPSFTFTGVFPANTTTGATLTPTLSVHIHETHGYQFNYTIKENTTGAWLDLVTGNNQNNGTYTHTDHTATAYLTKYWWKVTAVNDTTWHNETYYFTTLAPALPSFVFSGIGPANTSTGIALQPNVNETINETNGYAFNYTVKGNATGIWNTIVFGNDTHNLSLSNTYMSASGYSTKYWWKITATNSTTVTTAVYHFTTTTAPIGPPTTAITVSQAKANWTTSSSINLSWTKGANCTTTEVWRSTTEYLSSASNIYTGALAYFNDTLKDPAIRYYYTLKPYNSVSVLYGTSLNVSLAETDNTGASYCGASWIDFKGWLATDKSMKTYFKYGMSPALDTSFLNSTVIETSYTTGDDESQAVQYSTAWGETFRTETQRYYNYNVSVKILRYGSPGTVAINLYDANVTGLPTGAALSSGTKDCSGITTSASGGWYNFTMSPYHLKTNTMYCFMLSYSGFYTNYIRIRIDASSPTYTNGWAIRVQGSPPVTTNQSSRDIMFKIWGHEPNTYAYGSNTTNSDISSSGNFSITQHSLASGYLYYYKANANDTKGNMTKGNLRYTLTNPDVPVFLNIIPTFANNSVKITWVTGNGANRTIIRQSNIAYPTLVTDGTLAYNNTGSLCWGHNITFNSTYYFTLFSFTVWGGLSRFSSGIHIPWGGITLIVYNESKPWQVINASMLVTDSLGLHPVQFNNVYGYYSFNISQIPYGTNTLFYVSNISYYSKLYPITIIPNLFYNLSFYLPPLHPPGWNTTQENASASYVVQIWNEYQYPVTNALVKFYKMFNTTGNFTYIGGFVSDGNGEGSIRLFPYQLYMIKITADDFIDATYWWEPNIVDQGLIKQFMIYPSPPGGDDIWVNLTSNIDPINRNQYGSFTFYYNITSSDSQLDWFSMQVYRVHNTTGALTSLYLGNFTTPAGGTISYTVTNVTGKYYVKCMFKKTGFDTYRYGDINTYTYLIWPSDTSVSNLDNKLINTLGRSPIFVITTTGETVVSYIALLITFVVTVGLFTLSPRFAGFGLVLMGLLIGILKGPLGLIPNTVLNWTVAAAIIALGLILTISTKKEEVYG